MSKDYYIFHKAKDLVNNGLANSISEAFILAEDQLKLLKLDELVEVYYRSSNTFKQLVLEYFYKALLYKSLAKLVSYHRNFNDHKIRLAIGICYAKKVALTTDIKNLIDEYEICPTEFNFILEARIKELAANLIKQDLYELLKIKHHKDCSYIFLELLRK